MSISENAKKQKITGEKTKPATFKKLKEKEISSDEDTDSNESCKENDDPSESEPSDGDSDDESSDNNASNSNNKKKTKRDKELEKLVKKDFINKKHEIKSKQKVIESTTGILINKPSSHPLNAHRVWWEYMRSMKHKKRLKRFLIRELWKLHPTLDVMSTTANSNTIPMAPIKFDIFWTPIYTRILKKLADKEKHTTEARCLALYYMMKCLDWYHMKRAMGKQDSLIQEAILEALETQEKLTIFAHYEALLEVDNESEDLGKANFNSARFDRGPPKAFENELGCVAPERFKTLRNEREKQTKKEMSSIKKEKKYTYKSSFSKAKGKTKAPELDECFDENKHIPKDQEGGIAYCKYWQTDSCSRKGSCRYAHKCKYCGGVHPGYKCDKK